MDKQKILIADHDSRVLSTLTGFLSDEPYEIFKAENGIEGLEVLRREKNDLAIVEKHIAGLGGITFLETVKTEKIQTNILIMGGIEQMESTEKILKIGAVSVLNKPIIKGNFLAKIKAFMPPNGGMNWSENGQSGSDDSPSYPVPVQASQDKWKTDLESFLNEHYHDTDLKFDDLMCYFDLSRSHGCALFRKHFDKTYCEILREVRIAQAERFLKESSLCMHEIASQCGFRTPDRRRNSRKVRKVQTMKILHILDISLPHRQSGYSLRSQYIINTQKTLGFDPVVLTRWGRPEQLVDGVEYMDDVPYLRNTSEACAIRMGERLGKTDTPQIYHAGQEHHFRKRVARAIETEKPDVLHAASPGRNAQVAIDIGHHYGLSVVYEVRGLWHDSGVAQGMLIPDSEAYRQQHAEHVNAMQQADAVVTLSEVLKAECIREGIDENKIGVVPNGVAVEQYAPKNRLCELANRLGIEPGDVVLGYIGLVRSLEGLHLLLQACEVLCGRYANLKVLIVGGGRDLPALQREAHERGLADVVVFTGEIPHDQIAAYYAVIDVFVIPRTRSRVTELVTPMKPYEAMAMEKAVVVSDMAALREVIEDGETGRVFMADDVESLTQTCAELIENPALRMQLGQKGSEWVRSEHTWTQVVERYRGIYEAAIAVCPARMECINQQSKTRPRVAFYSQHLIGVGHHFRNRQIVNALVKTCDVFFIDGGRPVPKADLDEGVMRIPLPSLRAGAHGIEPVDTERDLQTVMREREGRLSEAMEQIRPDVLCVEFFPFSRWSLKSEILDTIVRLNEVNPGAKVLCSLRDIPTRAKSDELQPTAALVQRRDGNAMRFYSVPFGGIHHEYLAFNRRYYEEVVPVLNQYFDGVLVHGDPKLSQLEDHFPWGDDIGIPVVYTGFVSEKLEDASRPDGAPNRYVLVSAGGGAEGLALVAPCIKAWKQLEQDEALDGREMVIFAGAFIDERHFNALRELCGDGPFHIERFTSNFLAYMKHADLSISRAGYNTCMNVLETQVPSILVPSIAMDDQEFRAQQLMGLGLAQVIHPDHLSVAKMVKTIAEMLESSLPEHHLSLDGAEQTRKFIESLK